MDAKVLKDLLKAVSMLEGAEFDYRVSGFYSCAGAARLGMVRLSVGFDDGAEVSINADRVKSVAFHSEGYDVGFTIDTEDGAFGVTGLVTNPVEMIEGSGEVKRRRGRPPKQTKLPENTEEVAEGQG